MSSHEVIRHSRKILGIVKNKEAGIGHRIGEILIEILIIVFAISLSLLLERWRQKTEDRELEKNFLLGLKVDLVSDLDELNIASAKCISMKTAADYFLRPEDKIDWASDSIRHYAYQLFHNIYFFPNSNRYESLKSTGKLGVIENQQLQNDIINMYQTRIPDLKDQISLFDAFMNGPVKDYLIHHLPWNDKHEIVIEKSFFTSIEMKNIVYMYGDLKDVLRRADSTTVAGKRILGEIDQFFKE